MADGEFVSHHKANLLVNCSDPGALGTSFVHERRALLALVIREVFVRSSPERPLYANGGGPAPWMLDTLRLTLRADGARLAARCLVPLIRTFSSRQLATFGSTALPLLQSCVIELDTHGLLIRKERKLHGAYKLVEGPIDRSQPVIIVDDTLASGESMVRAIEALRDEGLDVEGAVCLIRYGTPGLQRIEAMGVRVESVLDLDDDVLPLVPEGSHLGPVNPTKWTTWPAWGPPAEEGLTPSVLARRAVETYLNDRLMLKPPTSLKVGNLDARGGVYVSVRNTQSIHSRLARDGFWTFPGEEAWPAPEGLVRAAVQTAHQLVQNGYGLEDLQDSSFAVTFFGPLLESHLADLDNSKTGLVVRSRLRLRKMGGALPNMPGIADAFQEFRHAHTRNAQLDDGEPYVVYRHTVEKDVEQGVEWQPTGVPGRNKPPFSETALRNVAERARQLVLKRRPTGNCPALPGADQLFVTLYVKGRLTGCLGIELSGRAIDEALREISREIWNDNRFAKRAHSPRDVAVTVSVLFNTFVTGVADTEFMERPFRFGDQCLEVSQDERRALLLPSVPLMFDFTPAQYVQEAVRKAGIEEGNLFWRRFDCASALASQRGALKLVNGLPPPEVSASFGALRSKLKKLATGYLKAHHAARGPMNGTYHPFSDVLIEGLDSARLAFVAWQKARLGLSKEARQDLSRLRSTSKAVLAFELLTRLELGDRGKRSTHLALELIESIDEHGAFDLGDASNDADFDYAPGQILLALAAGLRARLIEDTYHVVPKALERCLRRFRLNHSQGASPWLMQALVALGSIEEAKTIADEALTFQSKIDGAFLTAQQDDCPGCTSLCPLEGLAAIYAVAPSPRLRTAIEAGTHFINRLVYQEKDVPLLPNPARAMGGVRQSLVSGQVRIDFVAHLVNFLLNLPREMK